MRKLHLTLYVSLLKRALLSDRIDVLMIFSHKSRQRSRCSTLSAFLIILHYFGYGDF